MVTSLVTLQKPKDISVDDIEAELREIWRSYASDGSSVATRATTFSVIIYEPEEIQQLLAALGFYKNPIDGQHGPATRSAISKAQQTYDLPITSRVDQGTLKRLRAEFKALPPEKRHFDNADLRGFSLNEALAAQNPCRVITLCPTFDDEDTGVTAQVSAYCPVQKSSGSRLVCCEYITLRGTKQALDRVDNLVKSLVISDLPKFVWWKATPNPEQLLFQSMSEVSNCIILDSSYYGDAESELLKIHQLVASGVKVADLNWYRLAPWQELSAASFDPPERRMALLEMDQIGVDYEKGNAAQALLYLGWLASRLNWQPEDYTLEGGDYDLRRVNLKGNKHGRNIDVELAAIPVADAGEVLGDLTGLRMSSTNLEANCCTILCSETAGCMRMESGGGAQACYIQEVTAISDQRSDLLLEQQLQRWGEDVLFEESLEVTAQILKLLDAA
ncbi:MAG: glucose-6-phosphate dehydrogenase assembly protein OpcA [Leptolyngbyaceae cyanobacterium]